MRLLLSHHPETPTDAVAAIRVDIARPAPDRLSLRYEVEGDIIRLLVPAPALPERTDELWKSTCFEAFLKPPGGDAYVECNFSPSTQWALYAFDAYRERMRAAHGFDTPNIGIESGAERYTMFVELHGAALAASPAWRLGLSAVIEETNGRKSYWALKHPPGKPDFHHPDCFAAELGASERP